MKIENINTGFCYHRKQPFVNWIQDEKQQYFFSPIISSVYSVKRKLENIQNQTV